ncbi:MAG TPA: PqqD family protein [Acidimicrobiales bacterium]
MPYKPRRRDDVLFRQVDRGVVALDPKTQQAHALEPPAAQVWAACDGADDVDALAVRLEVPVDTVRHILGCLADAGLMNGENDRKFSRRAALAGSAGVGVGLVATIVLPTPAMAASRPNQTGISPESAQGEQTASAAETPTGPTTAGPTTTEPNTTTSTPRNGAHQTEPAQELAFTGADLTDDVAIAAGAIGAGAAIVAASRKASGR